MDQGFISVLQQLIAEQGKEPLLIPGKCKAILSDYARGDYKKESRLILQALDAGVAKAINNTQEMDLCKKQQIQILHAEYELVEETAADIVDTLAFVLRGDNSKTILQKTEKKPEPRAETVTVSANEVIKNESENANVNRRAEKQTEHNKKFIRKSIIIVLIVTVTIITLAFSIFLMYRNGVLTNNNDEQNLQSTSIQPQRAGIIPAAPSDVTIREESPNSIRVIWSAINDAAGYHVYRSISETGSFTRIGDLASTSYLDIGLAVNTTYYYCVLSYNDAGQSTRSLPVSAIIEKNVITPSTPTGVSAAAASSNSITVRWNEVPEATGYLVFRSAASGGTFAQIGTAASASYTDTGLSANTAYFYIVYAVNGAERSTPSQTVSARTNAATLPALSGTTWEFTDRNGSRTRFSYTSSNVTYTIFNRSGATIAGPERGTYTLRGNIITHNYGSGGGSESYTYDGTRIVSRVHSDMIFRRR